jgi:putative tryptophan/tyrosine transport system substrate-binding protein
MRRRDFITVAAGATAWVAAARAQGPRRTVGFLGSGSHLTFPGAPAAFVQGLEDGGFVEGKNVNIEWRWAEGQYNRLPSLVSELVSGGVTVIVGGDAPAALAAKAATKTIPIVFVTGADPVKLGLVDNFSHPNGNLTGVSILLSALGSKQLELLRELLVPNSGTIALLVNPGNPNFEVDVPDLRAAADALGLHLEVLIARTDSDLEAAFATMIRQRVSALVVKPDPFFSARRELLVTLAARHAMPAIYPFRTFVELGGLMSYGGAIPDLNRQAGTYVGKILRGAKPADLPVQQSVTFELLINLKTAKALGLTVPPSLLARADAVIE